VSTATPVWVLDDPRPGTAGQAIGIAERLGVPFRLVPMSWNRLAHMAVLAPRGSPIGLASAVGADAEGLAMERPPAEPPLLTISAGGRSAAAALWLRRRFGCRSVHCMRPPLVGDRFDLLVVPQHDRGPSGPNVMPVLGVPHRVSPEALRRAHDIWSERLGHLPSPRVALLLGGPIHGADLQPSLAHRLARQVARLANTRRGSVMATTSRRTGTEATEALAAGLDAAMHLMFRWGEPGENPYLGFLAMADAIVVSADSVSMVSEACAADAPVFIALPELAGGRHRRLHHSLIEAGQVRMLGDSLSPWSREPLDEAGHVADAVRRLVKLD
jgi:mitochondrial fission protein ELM1